MGVFWDKLKGLFKKPEQLPPSSPQIAAGLDQYERDERPKHSDDAIDAVSWSYAIDAANKDQWERQIKPPIRSNPRLHIRKAKSQRKNWSKWKKRLRR